MPVSPKLCLLPPLCLILCACLQTQVFKSQTVVDTQRLQKLNARPLSVSMHFHPNPDSLGHQYLLILFPFGNVGMKDPVQVLKVILEPKLALKGYKILYPRADLLAGAPRLVLIVKDASLSAYDYLFVRRVVASVSLQARFVDSGGNQRQAEVDSSASSFRRFGFEPQLERAYDEALSKGLEQILTNLGL